MDPPGERLLSCSLPCHGVTALNFLSAHEGQPRFAWSSDDGKLELAGAGNAAELFAWGQQRFVSIERDARKLFANALHNVAPQWAGPRLFGGFAFRHDFTPDNTWSIYTPAWFALPHYQLATSAGETWLTINAQVPADEPTANLQAALTAALQDKIAVLRAHPSAEPRNRLLDIDYPMTYEDWARMLDEAKARINAGDIRKVVLSRAAELRFDNPVELLPILRNLDEHYGDCYRFLFEPRPRYAFYGATPELLAAVGAHNLRTMSMAGSINRGESEYDDERLGSLLMNSAKDRNEQRIVTDRIRERLLPVCAELEVGKLELRKLRNIQHLCTPIHAKLPHPGGILPFVEILHPTPALGGEPRETALELIQNLEPIPRGWYGAPVGWLDSRLDGQFAVGIRSAVAQESRVWIYAGAGIVKRSESLAEWEETALKLRPMLEAHSAG